MFTVLSAAQSLNGANEVHVTVLTSTSNKRSFIYGCVGSCSTVKLVLNGHSKINKTKVVKTNGSLMKVESIAECSLGAFCNTFDLH